MGSIKLTSRLLTPRPSCVLFELQVSAMLGQSIARGTIHSSALATTAHITRKWWKLGEPVVQLWERKSKLWGKKERQDVTSGHKEQCDNLTQRCYKCKVLQHHIAVQESLSFIKEPPFLLGEVNGHVLKIHTLSQCGQFIL